MDLYPLKLHLEIPLTDESRDTELNSLLERAKQELINALGYKFDLTALDVTERHDCSLYIYPNYRPITSVTSVSWNDEALTLGTDYVVKSRYIKLLPEYAEEYDIDDHIDIVYKGGYSLTSDDYKAYTDIMCKTVAYWLDLKKSLLPQQFADQRIPKELDRLIDKLTDKVF
jgi:hypothetical protein